MSAPSGNPHSCTDKNGAEYKPPERRRQNKRKQNKNTKQYDKAAEVFAAAVTSFFSHNKKPPATLYAKGPILVFVPVNFPFFYLRSNLVQTNIALMAATAYSPILHGLPDTAAGLGNVVAVVKAAVSEI